MDAVELTREPRRQGDGPAAAPRTAVTGDSGGPQLRPLDRELDEWLDGRGALGACFALYLASRLDLVSASEAFALAARASANPGMPTAPERLLADALGGRRGKRVSALEERPFAVGPAFQWHRARLAGGEAVILKFVRPELIGEVQVRPDDFAAFRPRFFADRPGAFRAAVADFAAGLARALDLRREAADLDSLRAASEDSRLVTVPRVVGELSSSRLLVTEDRGAGGAADDAEAGGRRDRAARRLCRGWLELVLTGDLVPVEPTGGNVAPLDGSVEFRGGLFLPASRRLQAELRSYLAAAAVGDSRRVASTLTQLTRAHDEASERRLRHRVRHAEPFRDGGWSPEVDSLARLVFAHWRLAAASGFEPKPFFLGFLRGLFGVTWEARRLAPDKESFREAFQELRLRDVFAETARFADAGELEDLWRRQTSLVTVLPRRLEQLLTLASEPAEADRRERSEGSSGYAWTVLGSLLVAMSAVVLITALAGEATGLSVWIEKLGSLLVAALGLLAVRASLAER